MKRLLLVLSFAFLLTACGDARAAPAGATAPTATEAEFQRELELRCVSAGSRWVKAHADPRTGNWIEAYCLPMPRLPSR